MGEVTVNLLMFAVGMIRFGKIIKAAVYRVDLSVVRQEMIEARTKAMMDSMRNKYI